MNWGPNLDKPYLSFKLAHIWFVWTFLAKNKIGMLNFHFGDNLDPKFIPRRIPWGWTGDQPYFVVELFHIWFEWSLLAKNKIGMLNFNFGNDSEPQIHPQKDSLGMNWGQTLFKFIIWGQLWKSHFFTFYNLIKQSARYLKLP